MMKIIQLLAVLFMLSQLASAQPANSFDGKLRAIFVDVEGGQATLFITPAGESLLIDAGWPGRGYRDADRIVTAARKAGLSRIDYVLITHYHDDHVGGVPQLAERMPIGAFIDHGPNREMDGAVTEHGFAEYQRLLATGKYKHLTVKPGDVLPLTGVRAIVVSGDGKVLAQALPGGGKANAACASTEIRPPDQTENSRSLGVYFSFGKLTILDLGDLTWDKERDLVCPANKLGEVGVYIVSHHGWNQSSSPALVNSIHARVAIMDNGEAKGGSTPTLETVSKAPGLEALWQLHYSAEGGVPHNAAAEYIANPLGTDAGSAIELAGSRDGSFEVTNDRNGKTQHYTAR